MRRTRDLRPKLKGRALGHTLAVLHRACRVAHRLALQVAAIADQLPEQRDAAIGPFDRVLRFWQRTRDRQPVIDLELRDRPPAAERVQAMLRGRADRAAARELDLEDLAAADRPDLVADGMNDPSALVDREDLGSRAHQLLDRHPSTVREA